MQEPIELPTVKLRLTAQRFMRIVAVCLISVLVLWAQDSKAPQTPKNTAPSSLQISPSSLPPIQLDGAAVLSHLTQVISWYRHSTTGIQSVGLPSDAIYQDNAKSLGSQAVRLAFQSAKTEAALIAAQEKDGGAT